MSMKRGRPGSPAVAKGPLVGPETGENFRNPFNMGIDSTYGSDTGKTLCGPTSTPEGAGIALHDNYDEFWEGR